MILIQGLLAIIMAEIIGMRMRQTKDEDPQCYSLLCIFSLMLIFLGNIIGILFIFAYMLAGMIDIIKNLMA